MTYRVKTPQRFFAELDELAGKHGVSYFEATDNIVDMKYLKNVFSAIDEAKTNYQFFYKVKANLSRDQIRALHLGGVRGIQPGIVSLGTHVL
jgi:hypothetical protein